METTEPKKAATKAKKYKVTVIQPYYDKVLKKELSVGEEIETDEKRKKLLIDLKFVK